MRLLTFNLYCSGNIPNNSPKDCIQTCVCKTSLENLQFEFARTICGIVMKPKRVLKKQKESVAYITPDCILLSLCCSEISPKVSLEMCIGHVYTNSILKTSSLSLHVVIQMFRYSHLQETLAEKIWDSKNCIS